MKPLTEQLKKLEGIPVPDFGPLDDWAANRNAEMQRRARRAAGKGPLHLLGPTFTTFPHRELLASHVGVCLCHSLWFFLGRFC